MEKLDLFTSGYIEAVFFTADEDMSDKGLVDIASDDLVQICLECKNFQEDNKSLLDIAYEKLGYTENQAGIDFWFTRNGHGVGYWDRGLGKVGDELSVVSRQLKNSDVYAGDDELVYFTNLPRDRVVKKLNI